MAEQKFFRVPIGLDKSSIAIKNWCKCIKGPIFKGRETFVHTRRFLYPSYSLLISAPTVRVITFSRRTSIHIFFSRAIWTRTNHNRKGSNRYYITKFWIINGFSCKLPETQFNQTSRLSSYIRFWVESTISTKRANRF